MPEFVFHLIAQLCKRPLTIESVTLTLRLEEQSRDAARSTTSEKAASPTTSFLVNGITYFDNEVVDSLARKRQKMYA